ncbi:MAG: c-type cytochrome [Pseudomonadota bacterium]
MTNALPARAARSAIGAALAAAIAAGAAAQTADAPPPAPGHSGPLRYLIEDGERVARPLTETAGDVARGAALVRDAARAGCESCHSFAPGGADRDKHALHDVGARLSESALRLWMINAAVLAPDTEMPAYYSLFPTAEAEEPRSGPIFTAQEIEDVVAYLNTLGARR